MGCCTPTNSESTSDCCGSKPARTTTCPDCGRACDRVDYATLLHLVHAPRNQALPEQAYYFCSNPACDLVYHGADGSRLGRADLRVSVAQKQTDPARTLCYCFEVSEGTVRAEFARLGESPSRDFIVRQTKQGRCACEQRNPAGRCCLKDFPKAP